MPCPSSCPSLVTGLDSVEKLIKKHKDFEKSLALQEEKIRALDKLATKLIKGRHYAAEDIAANWDLLLRRLESLLADSKVWRRMLEDSNKYLQLHRRWTRMKEQEELEEQEKLEDLMEFAKNIVPNYRSYKISQILLEIGGQLRQLQLFNVRREIMNG